MSVSIQDLQSFHSFAIAKITAGESGLDWSELFRLWRLENPSDLDRREVVAIIKQGDQDISNGRGRDADQVNEELRNKYNLLAE